MVDGGTVSLQLRCKSLTPLCNEMSIIQELCEKVPWCKGGMNRNNYCDSMVLRQKTQECASVHR